MFYLNHHINISDKIAIYNLVFYYPKTLYAEIERGARARMQTLPAWKDHPK